MLATLKLGGGGVVEKRRVQFVDVADFSEEPGTQETRKLGNQETKEPENQDTKETKETKGCLT